MIWSGWKFFVGAESAAGQIGRGSGASRFLDFNINMVLRHFTLHITSAHWFKMERPAKRRRLSQDALSSSASEAEEQTAPPREALPSTSPAISRIKKRAVQPAPQSDLPPTTTDLESLPTSIQDVIDQDDTATFTSLGTDKWLVSALSHMSIKYPTRIQKATVPQILAGRDCIGGSRTGSGKTIAFGLPILQTWARQPSGIFALILTPTRELALQIYEQFQAIGGSQGIKCVLVTGGADMRQQAIALSNRPHVVIATPGRLADHVTNSGEDTIKGLKKVKFVVLDEADRLLASGTKGSMIDDVETCLDYLPPGKSSVPQTIESFWEQAMHDTLSRPSALFLSH